MSRPASTQRNLTLTEELEKLEQSITLTLQEIDHNFSRAHRIVTTSILPVVEQYAEQSKDVWEGSKFWKQFFEASANVSLSGYEEQPADDTGLETTVAEDTTATTHTTADEESESYATPSSEHLDLHHRDDELNLSSLTLSPSHSTPRPSEYPAPDDGDDTTISVSYQSPYEALRQEVASSDSPTELQQPQPSTPGKQSSKHHGLPQNIAVTPDSSPFLPPTSHAGPSTSTKGRHTPADPVLHHVLDKTYRVQATPLTSRKTTATHRTTATTTTTPKTKPKFYDDLSPLSSPEIEAPKLHEEIFSSPIKFDKLNRLRQEDSPYSTSKQTPKPGLSVLTPGKKKPVLSSQHRSGQHKKGPAGVWDSDDDDFDLDDDEIFGSPPKTMQFHVPQSRLLKTPAKEASKRIVSDLLQSARSEDITDEYGDYGIKDEEDSPSVVRRAEGLDDDSF